MKWPLVERMVVGGSLTSCTLLGCSYTSLISLERNKSLITITYPGAMVAIITECIISLLCLPFTITCYKLRQQFSLET